MAINNNNKRVLPPSIHGKPPLAKYSNTFFSEKKREFYKAQTYVWKQLCESVVPPRANLDQDSKFAGNNPYSPNVALRLRGIGTSLTTNTSPFAFG